MCDAIESDEQKELFLEDCCQGVLTSCRGIGSAIRRYESH
jgi:hypothetical protein